MFRWLFFIGALIFVLACSYHTAYGYDVSVSWKPSTTNVDGTPITDLDGYKIYYCSEHDLDDKIIDVHNLISYIVKGLDLSTTYYFKLTVYDTSGNESPFSEEKIIVTPECVDIIEGNYIIAEGDRVWSNPCLTIIK